MSFHLSKAFTIYSIKSKSNCLIKNKKIKTAVMKTIPIRDLKTEVPNRDFCIMYIMYFTYSI